MPWVLNFLCPLAFLYVFRIEILSYLLANNSLDPSLPLRDCLLCLLEPLAFCCHNRKP